jgi:hypothetical protein
MRPLVVVAVDEVIELGLLLEEVFAGRLDGRSSPERTRIGDVPGAFGERQCDTMNTLRVNEAAWVAAARGHEVTVFSASGEVGGKARLRAPLPGGETITSIYDYQYAAALRAGAKFRLAHKASVEDVMQLRPDAVVLACGSTMIPPDWLPPSEREYVPDLRMAMQEMSRIKSQQPGTAVIFGADHSEGTYAAAQALIALFERVVIVTPRDTIATEMQLVTRQGVLRRMAELHVQVISLATPIWSQSSSSGLSNTRMSTRVLAEQFSM